MPALLGLLACDDHIRMLVPLTSIPGSTVDLRDVLGNLLYGVILQCGMDPGSYVQSTSCSTLSFTVLEESYASSGGKITRPVFTAQIIDILGNTISKCAVPGWAVVATPTITPAGGMFTDSVKVKLGCATAGATIRYTVHGSDPNSSSPCTKNRHHHHQLSHARCQSVQDRYGRHNIAVAAFTIVVSPARLSPRPV